jgi:hypothetical protein
MSSSQTKPDLFLTDIDNEKDRIAKECKVLLSAVTFEDGQFIISGVAVELYKELYLDDKNNDSQVF